MNNKLLLYGIGAVVIIGVIIGFFAMQKPGNPDTDKQAATNTDNKAGQKMSMKALLGAGKTQKCAFTNTADSSNTSGTMYIDSGKMRSDFTSTVDGKTIQSHMIVMDNTSYVWSDAMPQGIKMTFDDIQKPDAASKSIDINQEVDFSCQDWTPDAGTISLPTGITFTDYSAMLKQVAPSGGSANSQQCAACDQAPDATSRAQCKTALGCK
jgi:hypothetical protein